MVKGKAALWGSFCRALNFTRPLSSGLIVPNVLPLYLKAAFNMLVWEADTKLEQTLLGGCLLLYTVA